MPSNNEKATTQVTSWDKMPGKLCGRWTLFQPFVRACFEQGMKLEVQAGEVVTLPPDASGAVFGGVGATYIPYLKLFLMVEGIAYGLDAQYGTYRGDIHELGHAIRYLLIKGKSFWQLHLMYEKAKRADRFLDEYSKSSVEEWWAQGWEAYWTRERSEADDGIDHNRDDLKAKDPDLHGFIQSIATLYRLDPEEYA